MTTRRIASCAHFDTNDAGLDLSKSSLTVPNSSTNDRSGFFSQSGKDVRCAWSVMKERVFSGGWRDGSRHQVRRGEGCHGLFQSRSGQRLVWRPRLWRTEDFGSPRTRADSQRIDEYPMGRRPRWAGIAIRHNNVRRSAVWFLGWSACRRVVRYGEAVQLQPEKVWMFSRDRSRRSQTLRRGTMPARMAD